MAASPATALPQGGEAAMTDRHADRPPAPEHPGVMVSSTYTDLRELRQVLIDAAQGASLFPEAMEHDAALPVPAHAPRMGKN